MTAVCHVNLSRGFRGGERQTELLVRGLAERGWRQQVVARRGEALAARLDGLPGVALFAVAGHALAAARATRGAAIVHAHEGRAIQAAWLRHRLSGTPFLVTRRIHAPPSARRLTRRMYREAACIVSISTAVKSVMDAYAPGTAGRIIPSALAHLPRDPARIAALRQRWAGRLVAGNVAALVERDKGQRMIIGAARRLADVHPELLFVLLGSGPDESALRSAAAGLANVVFEGQRDDVGDYLAAFDLFVFPSRSEGLGSTLLDAMDCGLPVVATRVGGIPDVVRDGETGLLVAMDDEAGLAAAIAGLARDPARREAMSRAARARALEFGPERMVESYARLYRELAGKAAA